MRAVVFFGGISTFVVGCAMFGYSLYTQERPEVFVAVGVLFAVCGVALASCLGEE